MLLSKSFFLVDVWISSREFSLKSTNKNTIRCHQWQWNEFGSLLRKHFWKVWCVSFFQRLRSSIFLLHVWHRLLTTMKLFCVRYAKSQTERERRKFLVRLSLTSLLFPKSIIANYIFVDLFYEAHDEITNVKILYLKCNKIIRANNGFDNFYFVNFIIANAIITQWPHPSNFNVKRMFILAYTDSKRLMVSLTYGQ